VAQEWCARLRQGEGEDAPVHATVGGSWRGSERLGLYCMITGREEEGCLLLAMAVDENTSSSSDAVCTGQAVHSQAAFASLLAIWPPFGSFGLAQT